MTDITYVIGQLSIDFTSDKPLQPSQRCLGWSIAEGWQGNIMNG
jgi:hypothetical protein